MTRSRPTFLQPFGPPLLQAELDADLVAALNRYADEHQSSDQLSMGADLEGRQRSEIRIDDGFNRHAELSSELLEMACLYLSRVEAARIELLGRRVVPADFHLDDTWVNTAVEGDHNPIHSHGGHLSGVFYLELPADAAGAEREHYPNKRAWYGGQTEWLFSLDHLHRHPWSNANFFAHGPVGSGYIFPAWLPHQAHPFRGPGRRRTMSFNMTIVAPEAQALT